MQTYVLEKKTDWFAFPTSKWQSQTSRAGRVVRNLRLTPSVSYSSSLLSHLNKLLEKEEANK